MGRGKGRRQWGRRGEGIIRSRARAGLLGVPAPIGSDGYISIDAPLRGGAAAIREGPRVTGGARDGGDGEGGTGTSHMAMLWMWGVGLSPDHSVHMLPQRFTFFWRKCFLNDGAP